MVHRRSMKNLETCLTRNAENQKLSWNYILELRGIGFGSTRIPRRTCTQPTYLQCGFLGRVHRKRIGGGYLGQEAMLTLPDDVQPCFLEEPLIQGVGPHKPFFHMLGLQMGRGGTQEGGFNDS